MAIAKMKKIKLIALQTNKEAILRRIQGIQSVELIDMSREYQEMELIPAHKKTEIEATIKKLENQYEEYQNQLHFVEPFLPKQSMLESLKAPRKTLTLQELEAETANLNQEEVISSVSTIRTRLGEIDQELQQMKEDEEFLLKWKRLTYVPNRIEKNQYVHVLTGTIPQTSSDEFIRAVRDNEHLYAEEIYQNKDEYGVTIIFSRDEESIVREVLEENHFFTLDYPFETLPQDELVRLEEEKALLLEEQKEIKHALSQMNDHAWSLKLMIETTYASLQRMRGQLLVVDESNLFVLEGWVEEKKLHWLQEEFAESLSTSDYALIVEDVMEEDIDNVPIVLENNKYVEPFETITSMYSLPKYNELDPTPFLMPFYLVFFGMMLADSGYGLVMLIATVIAQKYFTLNKGMQKSMRFFQMLSYGTIVWGLIYGSFFGLELPFVLLSTMNDVNTILLLSVAFGVIQIMLGLGIKTYLLIRERDFYGAVSEGISWLTIFVGIILLVLARLVMANEALSNVGIFIAILGALSVLVATSLGSQNKALGFGLGLYNLYGISGYVGDIVSYTRLMALGISGGSIGMAFNMIIEFMPPAARFTVGLLLFVLLHLVNIGLSALSAYVHGARLIFVEFFGKFYEGGGKGFNPLKTSEEYIDLDNKMNG